MKKSLFALILALVLICSFACASANTSGTAVTTADTTVAPPDIAESEWLLLAMPKEISEGHFKWKYKTVTNAEDINAIAEAVEKALENATVKPPLAEGELATSQDVRFRLRLSSGETVSVYGDGMFVGGEYEADTSLLISSLTEIYNRTDSEEKAWV